MKALTSQWKKKNVHPMASVASVLLFRDLNGTLHGSIMGNPKMVRKPKKKKEESRGASQSSPSTA